MNPFFKLILCLFFVVGLLWKRELFDYMKDSNPVLIRYWLKKKKRNQTFLRTMFKIN